MLILLSAILLVSPAVAVNQCSTGFEAGGDGNCYGTFSTPLTYEKAAEACQTHGGFLTTISNGFDNSFVRGLTLNLSSAWIGFNCPHQSCRWEDGSNRNYINDNSTCSTTSQQNTCGFIQPSGYWCYSDCCVARPYVCQVPDPSASPCYGWREGEYYYDNYCYKTFVQNETGTAAEQICQQNCGHLAYIPNEQENDAITKLLCLECTSTPTYTRIGLIEHGDNNYTWTNGKSFDPFNNDYSNFGVVLPNLGNCVNMALRDTTLVQRGQWINADCNEKTAFTCWRKQGKCTPAGLVKEWKETEVQPSVTKVKMNQN